MRFRGTNMQRRRKKSEPTPFGKILKTLMKERELTLRDAANIAGVSASTIDDWKSGTSPADYMAVKKLANEFGVSLSFLLTGEEDNENTFKSPTLTEVFEDGGSLFDGYAKITIQRLVPRKK